MESPVTSRQDQITGPPKHRGKSATVLLVDDHPLLREGLRTLLARDPGVSVCGEAGTLAEAGRLVSELRPDLVLLDFDLPDGDSLAFVETLRALPGGPRVVVLCGRDDPGGADAIAIRMGASGFVSKRTSGEEVLRVVRNALGGQTYLSTEMIEKLLKRRGRPGDGA